MIKNIHNLESKKKDIRTYLLVMFFIFMALFVAYSIAIALPFAYHDDYYYFAYDDRNNYILNHPQGRFFLFVGRELYVSFAFLMAKFIHTLADLSQVRFVYIVLLAFAGTLITRILVIFGISTFQAMALAISICLLPGFQAGVLWITMVPFSGALIFSLVGGASAIKMAELHVTNHDRLSLKLLWDMKLGFILALTAMFFYQPWAMFYFLPIFAYVAFAQVDRARKIILITLSAITNFFFSASTYFLLHKYVLMPYFFSLYPQDRAAFESDPTFNFKLTSDIYEKLDFFINGVMWHAINLWNIYLSANWLYAVLTFMLVGLISTCYKYRVSQRKALRELVIRAVILSLISVGSVLPVLMAAGGHSQFRVVAPLSAMIILMLGWAVLKTSELFSNRRHTNYFSNTFIGSICVFACITAWGNVKDSAVNAREEYLMVKSLVSTHLREHGSEKVLVYQLADPSLSVSTGKPTVNEFNLNSTAYWQDIPWIMRAALIEMGFSGEKACVAPVKANPPDECLKVKTISYGTR